MQTIMKEISELKLSDPKHRKNFFNYMGQSSYSAYAEAAFILCAWDYIFNPSDEKAAAFPKVFLRTGSPLELNLGGKDRSKAVSMLGAHDITLKSFGSDNLKHTVKNFKKDAGVRAGGAANYNIYTNFIEHCERTRYRDRTAKAQQEMVNNGALPAANAAGFAIEETCSELRPYWGDKGLKALGIAA